MSGKIYYTSDLYLGYKNILDFSKRTFKDINEMNSILIKKWNNKVKDDEGRKVILFHYPIVDWNHKHYVSYHLYGHVHDSAGKDIEYMKIEKRAFNVGIDVNNYEPMTLDELIKV